MVFVCIVCRELLTNHPQPQSDVVNNTGGAAGGTPHKINVDIVATQCGHMYHRVCLDDWFNKQEYPRQECPYCKSTVVGREYLRLFPIGDEESDDIESLKVESAVLKSEITQFETLLEETRTQLQDKTLALDILQYEFNQKRAKESEPKNENKQALQTKVPSNLEFQVKEKFSWDRKLGDITRKISSVRAEPEKPKSGHGLDKSSVFKASNNSLDLAEFPALDQMSATMKIKRDFRARRPNRRASVNDITAAAVEEKQTAVIVKQTRAILNELTPENFDQLCENFVELHLNEGQDRISAVVKIIFEKAMDESCSSTLYAKLVHHVSQHSWGISKKFRKEILLDQCQRNFYKTNGDKEEISKKLNEIEEAVNDKKEILKLELKELFAVIRRRSLANVQFIGELFKLQMIPPKILVDCVHMLLGNQDEESYECLCELLTMVGEKLDMSLKDVENRVRDDNAKSPGIPPGKFISEDNYMDNTFKKLRTLSNDPNLSSRVRFALQELVEFRDQKWVSRRDSNASDKTATPEEEEEI